MREGFVGARSEIVEDRQLRVEMGRGSGVDGGVFADSTNPPVDYVLVLLLARRLVLEILALESLTIRHK